MRLTIDDRDARRTLRVLERMPRRLTAAIRTGMRDEARELAKETRTRLRGPARRGRKRKGQKRERAEAGAFPRRQTGALSRSIRFKATRGRAIGYLVYSSDPGAVALEASGHAFLSVVLDARRDAIFARLSREIGRALDRAARE